MSQQRREQTEASRSKEAADRWPAEKSGASNGQAAEVDVRGKRLSEIAIPGPFWVAPLPWNIVSCGKRREGEHGVYLAQERKQERKTTRSPKRLRGERGIKSGAKSDGETARSKGEFTA